MFGAVLDANVLVPSLLRDVLLTLGAGGMYKPLWSPVILDETERAIRMLRRERKLDGDDTDRYISRLLSEMQKNFPDASTTGWEHLEGTFGLPDADDEHVAALAMHAHAGVIVTDNLRDFPEHKLPGELHALSGTEFLNTTIDTNPAHAAVELDAMARRRESTLGDLLGVMTLQFGSVLSVDLLKPYADAAARSE